MLRPAAKAHGQAVECGGRGGVRQAESFGGGEDRALCSVGRAGDMGAEAFQPGDFRREVMERPAAPCGEGLGTGSGRPQGLAAVEVACGPQADALVDQRGPIDPSRLGSEIGNGRQSARGRAITQRLGHFAQGGDSRRLQGRGRGGERFGKIIGADPAILDGGGIFGAGTRDADPGDAGKSGRCAGEIFSGLPEEGVHRHGRIQREGGRNGAAGSLGGFEHRGKAGRGDVSVVHQHGIVSVGAFISGSLWCGSRRLRGPAGR